MCSEAVTAFDLRSWSQSLSWFSYLTWRQHESSVRRPCSEAVDVAGYSIEKQPCGNFHRTHKLPYQVYSTARRGTKLIKVTEKHTHPFNGPLSRTTRVSRYPKDKTNLDSAEARDSEWQWHQLGHMQVCT